MLRISGGKLLQNQLCPVCGAVIYKEKTIGAGEFRKFFRIPPARFIELPDACCLVIAGNNDIQLHLSALLSFQDLHVLLSK